MPKLKITQDQIANFAPAGAVGAPLLGGRKILAARHMLRKIELLIDREDGTHVHGVDSDHLCAAFRLAPLWLKLQRHQDLWDHELIFDDEFVPQDLSAEIEGFDARYNSSRRNFEICVSFRHDVGRQVVVETGPDDQIVWAQRKKRPGLSRIVRSRAPVPTKSVTLIVRRPRGVEGADLLWEVVTAYYGTRTAIELWNFAHLQESLRPAHRWNALKGYWLGTDQTPGHAFVYDLNEIEVNSLRQFADETSYVETLRRERAFAE